MKQKSKFFEIYKVFKAMVENCFSKNIKSIISDKVGEYIKRDLQCYCESKGI